MFHFVLLVFFSAFLAVALQKFIAKFWSLVPPKCTTNAAASEENLIDSVGPVQLKGGGLNGDKTIQSLRSRLEHLSGELLCANTRRMELEQEIAEMQRCQTKTRAKAKSEPPIGKGKALDHLMQMCVHTASDGECWHFQRLCRKACARKSSQVEALHGMRASAKARKLLASL